MLCAVPWRAYYLKQILLVQDISLRGCPIIPSPSAGSTFINQSGKEYGTPFLYMIVQKKDLYCLQTMVLPGKLYQLDARQSCRLPKVLFMWISEKWVLCENTALIKGIIMCITFSQTKNAYFLCLLTKKCLSWLIL